FNEINVDPAADVMGTATVVEGDANCDGASDTVKDEFVEISNVSAKSLDLTGVALWDAAAMTGTTPKFVFPAAVLGPGESVLVFGGALGTAPTTSPWCATVGGGRLGDALAFAGSALGLNNGNETVFLTATNMKASLALATAMVPTGKGTDQSYARDVDFTGAFADYTTIAGRATDRAFTPGTRVSGLPFASASAP
ncbi:MAG TPA: lamin tail domain-containing protein, partial [Kofleriaceae bacterium]|nr:lamin tail domain-containing protein [Kofleriaceae bacterium]